MKIYLGKACGPYQIRNRIRMSHRMVQLPSTTRVIELLHMDLTRSMQVESIGGKKVCFCLC